MAEMVSVLKDANEQRTSEQHLATGAYKLYRPQYTYRPRTSELPAVAIIDNSYAPTLSFLTSLGQKGVDIHVYGSQRWSTTRGSRYCSKFEHCPSPDRYAEFMPWLRNKIRSGEITRVAPTSDLIIYYIAALREEFSVEVQRSIPRLAEIENCLIKSRFHVICQQHNIPVPETCAPTTVDDALAYAEHLGYPVMLKPKSHLVVGMAERGRVIESPEQLRQQFCAYTIFPGHEPLAGLYPELRWPLIQKYIPPGEHHVYSVSGIKDAYMGIAAEAVSYKREQWPPTTGTSMAQVGCEDDRVSSTGLRIVDVLLSRGIFEIELIADGNQLLAIDLNPRGFGFMMLDVARGNDLPWLWLQSTLSPITHHEAGQLHTSMECRATIPFYLSRWLAVLQGPQRRRKLARLWRDMRQPSVAMIGSWRDPVPALLARLSVLVHPRHLLRTSWAAARKIVQDDCESGK